VSGSTSGRVLIAGTASLLMCLFLSPKFIDFLRNREFGQNIREEGPQGHQTKAGTPTMGGIIIFLAIAVPYVLLSQLDWRSLGVFFAAVACALHRVAHHPPGFVVGVDIIKQAQIVLRAIDQADQRLQPFAACDQQGQAIAVHRKVLLPAEARLFGCFR